MHSFLPVSSMEESLSLPFPALEAACILGSWPLAPSVSSSRSSLSHTESLYDSSASLLHIYRSCRNKVPQTGGLSHRNCRSLKAKSPDRGVGRACSFRGPRGKGLPQASLPGRPVADGLPRVFRPSSLLYLSV